MRDRVALALSRAEVSARLEFLVLLITDFLGWTKVFPFTRQVK